MDNQTTVFHPQQSSMNIFIYNFFSIDILKGYGGTLLVIFGMSLANLQVLLGILAASIGVVVSSFAVQKSRSELRRARYEEAIAKAQYEETLKSESNGSSSRSNR